MSAFIGLGGNNGSGTPGADGLSAYHVAVADGFVGTINEWILSLQGQSAYALAVQEGFVGSLNAWIISLQGDGVSSVAGKVGVVVLVKDDVGLAFVDNTADLDKPISDAQQDEFDLKAPLLSPSFSGTLTHSGDIVLSGSGKRITGDFSTTVISNRPMFQTSVANSHTIVCAIPSGIAQTAIIQVFNNSDPNNSSGLNIQTTATETAIKSNIVGSGTYLPLAFYVTAQARLRIDTSGNVLVISPAGLGYGAGAGGTVTQATSKTTAVTLNKPCGQITMNNEALAAGAIAAFLVNNTLCDYIDTVIVNHRSGGNYNIWSVPGIGNITLYVKNITAGSLTEAVVINFAIIKGSLS